MKKLIELDAALDGVANILDYEIAKGHSGSISRKGVVDMLTALPTVDPVRHGRWIRHDYADIVDGYYVPEYECSECKGWVKDDTDFCPNCGAWMEGEQI